MGGSTDKLNSELQAWVEPEILSLAVNETAIRPDRGTDGETRWIDCTS